MPFFRSIVNWIKRAAVATALAELEAELEANGAVVTEPPVLALADESTPQIESPSKATRKKTAKKK